MLDIANCLDTAIAAAKGTGEWLAHHYGKVEHSFKAGTDVPATAVISAVDAEAEQKIRSILNEFDNSIGFRGEETNEGRISGTHWLVDPIDGTSHFIRGLPFCTTMISLISEGQVVVAVIHDIARNETYWASKGEGAFKDGKRLAVSQRPLANAMLSLDTRFGSEHNEQLYIKMQRLTNGLFDSINSGYEHAMVAAGKLDGRICVDPYGNDWDYAGGALLVSEAGGTVFNLGTSDAYDYKDHNFIATNKVIATELQEAIPELFT